MHRMRDNNKYQLTNWTQNECPESSQEIQNQQFLLGHYWKDNKRR